MIDVKDNVQVNPRAVEILTQNNNNRKKTLELLPWWYRLSSSKLKITFCYAVQKIKLGLKPLDLMALFDEQDSVLFIFKKYSHSFLHAYIQVH